MTIDEAGKHWTDLGMPNPYGMLDGGLEVLKTARKQLKGRKFNPKLDDKISVELTEGQLYALISSAADVLVRKGIEVDVLS